MAYPPNIYPPNRQDDTPSATNHPADHNQLSNAISDIVNELGNNPSGAQGTLQTRIGAVETGKLARDGSQAMTGVLTLSGTDGTGSNVAMRRAWIVGEDAKRVAVAGDTMTGNLQIGGDPGTADGILFTQSDGAGWFSSSRANSPVVAVKIRGAGASTNGAFFMRFTNSDAETVCGSITKPNPGNVAYNTSSDGRLKRILGPVRDAVDLIGALRPVRFRWREGNGTTELGFDARDVQQVMPWAVFGQPDAVTDTGAVDPMQLNLSAIIAPLVAAVQELSERVRALEA